MLAVITLGLSLFLGQVNDGPESRAISPHLVSEMCRGLIDSDVNFRRHSAHQLDEEIQASRLCVLKSHIPLDWILNALSQGVRDTDREVHDASVSAFIGLGPIAAHSINLLIAEERIRWSDGRLADDLAKACRTFGPSCRGTLWKLAEDDRNPNRETALQCLPFAGKLDPKEIDKLFGWLGRDLSQDPYGTKPDVSRQAIELADILLTNAQDDPRLTTLLLDKPGNQNQRLRNYRVELLKRRIDQNALRIINTLANSDSSQDDKTDAGTVIKQAPRIPRELFQYLAQHANDRGYSYYDVSAFLHADPADIEALARSATTSDQINLVCEIAKESGKATDATITLLSSRLSAVSDMTKGLILNLLKDRAPTTETVYQDVISIYAKPQVDLKAKCLTVLTRWFAGKAGTTDACMEGLLSNEPVLLAAAISGLDVVKATSLITDATYNKLLKVPDRDVRMATCTALADFPRPELFRNLIDSFFSSNLGGWELDPLKKLQGPLVEWLRTNIANSAVLSNTQILLTCLDKPDTATTHRLLSSFVGQESSVYARKDQLSIYLIAAARASEEERRYLTDRLAGMLSGPYSDWATEELLKICDPGKTIPVALLRRASSPASKSASEQVTCIRVATILAESHTYSPFAINVLLQLLHLEPYAASDLTYSLREALHGSRSIEDGVSYLLRSYSTNCPQFLLDVQRRAIEGTDQESRVCLQSIPLDIPTSDIVVAKLLLIPSRTEQALRMAHEMGPLGPQVTSALDALCDSPDRTLAYSAVSDLAHSGEAGQTLLIKKLRLHYDRQIVGLLLESASKSFLENSLQGVHWKKSRGLGELKRTLLMNISEMRNRRDLGSSSLFDDLNNSEQLMNRIHALVRRAESPTLATKDRIEAVRTLGAWEYAPEVRKALARLLIIETDEISTAAYQELAGLAQYDPSDIPILVKLSAKKDVKWQLEAITLLRFVRTSNLSEQDLYAVNLLADRAVMSKSPLVRRNAWKVGRHSLLSIVSFGLSDADETAKQAAIEALQNCSPYDGRGYLDVLENALRQILAGQNKDLAIAALLVAGHFQIENLVPDISRWLKDSETERWARKALNEMPSFLNSNPDRSAATSRRHTLWPPPRPSTVMPIFLTDVVASSQGEKLWNIYVNLRSSFSDLGYSTSVYLAPQGFLLVASGEFFRENARTSSPGRTALDNLYPDSLGETFSFFLHGPPDQSYRVFAVAVSLVPYESGDLPRRQESIGWALGGASDLPNACPTDVGQLNAKVDTSIKLLVYEFDPVGNSQARIAAKYSANVHWAASGLRDRMRANRLRN